MKTNPNWPPYYQDDAVVIYHGKWEDILMTLEPVDHVITDPPYSEHTHSKQWIGAALTDEGKPRVGTAHTELGFKPLTVTEAVQFAAAVRVLCKRWALIFCDLESIYSWRSAILRAELDYVRACIWDKVDSSPQFSGDRPAASAEGIIVAAPPGRKRWNGGGSRNVYRHAVNGDKGPKPHPATKPQGLMRELVQLYTDPSELIVDPYMGSGSTLRACKDLGRRAIGIEEQEKWCEVAARRMAQETLDLWGTQELTAEALADREGAELLEAIDAEFEELVPGEVIDAEVDPEPWVCGQCGCTESTPCETRAGELCAWAAPDLCTACEELGPVIERKEREL